MSSKLAWCAHVLLYLLLATAATHVSVSATNGTTTSTTTTTTATTPTNATLAPTNMTPAPANTTLTGCQICGATKNCTDAVGPGIYGIFCGTGLIGGDASGACCCTYYSICPSDSSNACVCEDDPRVEQYENDTNSIYLVLGGLLAACLAALCLLALLCSKLCCDESNSSSRQRTGRGRTQVVAPTRSR